MYIDRVITGNDATQSKEQQATVPLSSLFTSLFLSSVLCDHSYLLADFCILASFYCNATTIIHTTNIFATVTVSLLIPTNRGKLTGKCITANALMHLPVSFPPYVIDMSLQMVRQRGEHTQTELYQHAKEEATLILSRLHLNGFWSLTRS